MYPDPGHAAAFAEGRRLREASRRQRARSRRRDLHHRYPYQHQRLVQHAPPSRWLLLAAAPFIAVGASLLAFLIFVTVILGMVASARSSCCWSPA